MTNCLGTRRRSLRRRSNRRDAREKRPIDTEDRSGLSVAVTASQHHSEQVSDVRTTPWAARSGCPPQARVIDILGSVIAVAMHFPSYGYFPPGCMVSIWCPFFAGTRETERKG